MVGPSSFETSARTLDDYWRSIVLFGRNVASYKFALARSLLELTSHKQDLITLEDLAPRFAQHICRHLQVCDKQATSRSSKFLNACRQFNEGSLDEIQLAETTVKLGFQNVIDAFHVVQGGDIPKRFFIDERRESNGIRITDNLYELSQSGQFRNLNQEVEARWRLVETAWAEDISRNLLLMRYDSEGRLLWTRSSGRRIDVTSCRDALDGYQKGICFYCLEPISIVSGDEDLGDVDHFLPWSLGRDQLFENPNGVWNLVLACKACNRGPGGKHDRVPALMLLERLNRRNEYLIGSHHPLRETIIAQTGKTVGARGSYLKTAWDAARVNPQADWEPETLGPDPFQGID